MNYGVIYDRIVERAWFRKLKQGEWHHVVPCCMGGKGMAVIQLTFKEHFVVHQLLVRMYPWGRRLIYAANLMASRAGSGREYAWIRKKVAEDMIGNKRGVGRVVSIKERERTSKFHKGNKWNYGRKLSEEARAKISKGNSGKKRTKEQCDLLRKRMLGVSPPNKGVPLSQEMKDRISRALMGHKHSVETKEKMRKAKLGRRLGVSGHKQTEETRRKISEKMSGVPKSEETKRKMSDAQRGNKHALGLIRGPMSDEHKRKMIESKRRNVELKKELYEKNR